MPADGVEQGSSCLKALPYGFNASGRRHAGRLRPAHGGPPAPGSRRPFPEGDARNTPVGGNPNLLLPGPGSGRPGRPSQQARRGFIGDQRPSLIVCRQFQGCCVSGSCAPTCFGQFNGGPGGGGGVHIHYELSCCTGRVPRRQQRRPFTAPPVSDFKLRPTLWAPRRCCPSGWPAEMAGSSCQSWCSGSKFQVRTRGIRPAGSQAREPHELVTCDSDPGLSIVALAHSEAARRRPSRPGRPCFLSLGDSDPLGNSPQIPIPLLSAQF